MNIRWRRTSSCVGTRNAPMTPPAGLRSQAKEGRRSCSIAVPDESDGPCVTVSTSRNMKMIRVVLPYHLRNLAHARPRGCSRSGCCGAGLSVLDSLGCGLEDPLSDLCGHHPRPCPRAEAASVPAGFFAPARTWSLDSAGHPRCPESGRDLGKGRSCLIIFSGCDCREIKATATLMWEQSSLLCCPSASIFLCTS